MKLCTCQGCGQIVFFENTTCERCRRRLGFCSETATILALEPAEAGTPSPSEGWLPFGATPEAPVRRFCSNAQYDVCNWLVPEDRDQALCVACSFNHVIPDLSVAPNLERWRRLEQAEHRLIYSLMQLKLPLKTRLQDPVGGLEFDFPDDPPDGDPSRKVLTGHDEGIVTIALREADDAEREKMRVEMGEHYRTLLGHFRHEIGHFYWNVLVRDAGNLDACRAVFGDDTLDYGAALQRHYAEGPPPSWQENYVSAYATMHPWEDFAETWAHYLHMVDTLQTAESFGMRVDAAEVDDGSLSQRFDFDPCAPDSFDELLQAWPTLTIAVNSLNRSMGLADLYPFVISQPIAAKLGFVHRLIHNLPLS